LIPGFRQNVWDVLLILHNQVGIARGDFHSFKIVSAKQNLSGDQ
jgi:hypothetical protein